MNGFVSKSGGLSSVSLETPDFSEVLKLRLERNQKFLERLRACGSSELLSEREASAIKIQKAFRGYLGRKKYCDRIHAQFSASEKILRRREEEQVVEGELLVESYFLEQELKDTVTIDHNKLRFLNDKALIIQRAWRFRRSKPFNDHVCCLCNDDYPTVYEYYRQTEKLCFCCDEHKLGGFVKDTLLDWEMQRGSVEYKKICHEVNNNMKKVLKKERQNEKPVRPLLNKQHSINVLQREISTLEKQVSEKNNLLMQELIIRDELHLEHEELRTKINDLELTK